MLPRLQIPWDLYLEFRTHVFLTLDFDRAVVVLHDPVGDRQSQSRPLTDWLGGEEWVEDVASDRFGNARAVVSNRDRKHVVRLACGDDDFSLTLDGVQGIGN